MVFRIKFFKEIVFLIFFIALILKLFGYSGFFRHLGSTFRITSFDFSEQIHWKNIELKKKQGISENNLKASFIREKNASVDLAFIFMNAVSNVPLQYHLRRALRSILQHSSAPISLYAITDNQSISICTNIINEAQKLGNITMSFAKVAFVLASNFNIEMQPTVIVLQDYFTNRNTIKYKDFLFFFSLYMDHLLPGINNVILIDIDVQVLGDISQLNDHFRNFIEQQIIGLAPELSPVYHHILSAYRKKNPNTLLGSSLKKGGFPGYNSGVLLLNVPKLKASVVIRSYLNRTILGERTKHYSFQGHLGDQDLFTLIAFDHPEIFYTLPCTWNRQLCKWWKSRGYESIFEEYYECLGDVKLIHGNCKSEISSE